ncbi:MAG: Nramp family divalent metal transporter [Halobacteria archaeon]
MGLLPEKIKRFGYYLGPGFIISVAYMDPGNWAANMNAGSKFGNKLLWVIIASSIIAMGIQIITAKLGIATGKGIAEHCRERFSRTKTVFLWAVAEIAMIATDMAEIIGAAIGFSLLFGIPLIWGAVLSGVAAFALLGIRTMAKKGYRVVEVTIMVMVAVVSLGFVIEMFIASPTSEEILGGMVPAIPNSEALYLSLSVLGATVMPHSIYLHPNIVQDRRKRLIDRDGDEESVHWTHFKFESAETVLALSGSTFVNAAMLIVAAAALQGTGIYSLTEAYITISNVFGSFASEIFGLALITAGLASSIVATMAGQSVMDEFLGWNFNVWIRRTVTLVPSLAVVWMGFDPTSVLVASQVALSFELPFVLIPLVLFTRKKSIMGSFTNRKTTTVTLAAVVTVIVVLNIWLLISTVT